MSEPAAKRSPVVVDSSFIVDLLAGVPGVAANASRFGAVQFHAPHVLDLEFLSSIRSSANKGRITHLEGVRMINRFVELSIVWHSHRPFLARIWVLRENITAYDACFVALAESLGAPLLTRDGRLARAPGHAARIEYID